jgi:hypothetical protein
VKNHHNQLKVIYCYGPPLLVWLLALYVLWRAVEQGDGTAAHRGYVVGILLLAADLAITVRLLQRGYADHHRRRLSEDFGQVAAEVAALRREVTALSQKVEGKNLAEKAWKTRPALHVAEPNDCGE